MGSRGVRPPLPETRHPSHTDLPTQYTQVQPEPAPFYTHSLPIDGLIRAQTRPKSGCSGGLSSVATDSLATRTRLPPNHDTAGAPAQAIYGRGSPTQETRHIVGHRPTHRAALWGYADPGLSRTRLPIGPTLRRPMEAAGGDLHASTQSRTTHRSPSVRSRSSLSPPHHKSTLFTAVYTHRYPLPTPYGPDRAPNLPINGYTTGRAGLNVGT